LGCACAPKRAHLLEHQKAFLPVHVILSDMGDFYVGV
jgi:hypothetical protein